MKSAYTLRLPRLPRLSRLSLLSRRSRLSRFQRCPLPPRVSHPLGVEGHRLLCLGGQRLVVALICLLCVLPAALPQAAFAVSGAMCMAPGGAPGPLPGITGSGFGAIGPDASPAGDRFLGDFITDLVGATSPKAASPCAAPAAGPAASASEPASLPASSPGQAAGNPVDLVTGNKYTRNTDVVMPDPESGLDSALREALGEDAERALGELWQPFAPLGFVFSRHYNSRFAATGPLGPGWRHGFETALARLRGSRGIELQIVQADGRRIVFRSERGRKQPRYSGGQIADGYVDEDLQAPLPWSWRWPDGRVLRFDADGRLASIEALDRDRIVLHRDRFGFLQKIVDGSHRALVLEHRGARLVGLVLPDGARIAYDYDPHGVLSAVRYPDGRTLTYQYDDPRAFHLLTGILLPDGAQSRYRYDDTMRVAESVPTEGSRLKAIALEYRLPQSQGAPGETVVREGSRVSRWQWKVDGEWGSSQLLSVEGEPCSSCPSLQAERRSAKPVREASAPGKALRHDSLGLPSEARLSGFARTIDGVATPIEIHLRWQRHAEGKLAGKLVWVERLAADGTGARTVFRHDTRRMLVALERPEALVDRFERDSLGRAQVRHRADRGRLEARFDRGWRLSEWRNGDAVTAIKWNKDGQPVSLAWPAGDHWTLRWQARDVEIESDRGWITRSATPAAFAAKSPAMAEGPTPIDATSQVEAAGAATVALVLSHPHPVVIDAAGRRTDRLYDDFGRLVEDISSVAGVKRFRYDAWGRISAIESSGGVAERRRHDLAGRLIEREELAPGERIVTRFRWDGGLLVGVDHPTQRTKVEHDALGRVAAIEHDLLGATQRWTIERDARERIVAQGLPDGSRLRHRFDRTGQPVGLVYEPADGSAAVPIVERAAYRNGRAMEWRYGNGVRFERQDDRAGRPIAWRWIGLDSLPDWRYRWSPEGLPLSIVDRNNERRFGWDAFGRLIVQERHGFGAPETEYFAWDLAGDLRLAQRLDGTTWRDRDADVPRSPTGAPLRHGELALHYGAQQRISEVSRADQPVASYAYNAGGERAIKRNGSATTGFLYRERALAAELDAQGKLTRHYLRWQGQPVAIVDREQGRTKVTWLHGDHLGTPHAATDAAGRPVWRADYEAFGRVARERGSFRQPLRFAGQYHDAETGLHDNYLRSYDPKAARYLEPDPLGLAGGLNPWLYADGNPLMATDPLGLILFAFDGTYSGDPAPEPYDISNVVKFYRLYDDGRRWYMTGVGLKDPESGIKTNLTDIFNGNTARARVTYMVNQLDAYMDDSRIGQMTNIDIVGYSRGAAMARDFVHRIEELQVRKSWQEKGMCINLRFLGLWETVSQFGERGNLNHEWQLGIPSRVGAAYHAVALNEHRTIIPVERAWGRTVVERGFVGDHADVGGGTAEGDLSDISLVWMTKMATDAGMKMEHLDSYAIVSSPILHNRKLRSRQMRRPGTRADRAAAREARQREREPLEVGQGDDARQDARRHGEGRETAHGSYPENEFAGDRMASVHDETGTIFSKAKQRESEVDGMTWSESREFITLLPIKTTDSEGTQTIAGSVDMKAYAAWLADNYGITVAVQ